MNTALILIISIVVLLCGYVFYGKWLAEQWGVDPSKKTPAHELEDGVDYVPAKAPVLMGHHFSSIAGAGPINGPIQAAIFGWIPVLLWVLIGGIFFGGVHDFGALFASIRHKGQSIGEVIDDAMGRMAKKIFIIFGYLTLLLVVAAFSSIVASTFGSTSAAGVALEGEALTSHQQTAMISLLFIVLAIVFGFLVYRKNVPIGPASIIGVVGIIIIVAIGMNFYPISISYNMWMWILAVYILIASVTPVWILLQPRDYLSSFLLYFMIAVAVVAIIGSAIAIGVAFGKNIDMIKQKIGEMVLDGLKKFSELGEGIKNKINTARDAVHNAIERIKSFFKFEWSLPHLKLVFQDHTSGNNTCRTIGRNKKCAQ